MYGMTAKLSYAPPLILATALAVTACGGGGGSGNGGANGNGTGNGSDSPADERPDFFDSFESVTNHGEFQTALDEAAGYSRDDDALEDSDDAFLIEIADDIDDDGFASAGHLEYTGDVNLYIRADDAGMHTIDADGDARILNIDADTRIGVTGETWIEGLRFVNGDSFDGDGGAITSSDHDIFVIDSEFESNRAEDNNGGAIQTGFERVIADGSSFTDNVAGGPDATAGGRGGAISASEAVVHDSEFNGNGFIDDVGAGGAIRADEIEIRNTTFVSHRADPGSGSPNGRGGAVFTLGGTVEDSEFENNESEYGGAIGVGRSGTLGNASLTPLEVTGSEFSNNTAEAEGGAIHATPISSEDDQADFHIQVTGTLFDTNIADAASSGGAVHTEVWDGDIQSENSTYRDNEQEVLVSEEGELVDLGGNTFEGNPEPAWD